MNRLLNLRFYKIRCFSPSPTLPWLFCPFKFFFVSIYRVVVCNLEFILPYGKWVPFVVKRERQTIFTTEDSTKRKMVTGKTFKVWKVTNFYYI
jgi:type IV secretory pathway component VirB8